MGKILRWGYVAGEVLGSFRIEMILLVVMNELSFCFRVGKDTFSKVREEGRFFKVFWILFRCKSSFSGIFRDLSSVGEFFKRYYFSIFCFNKEYLRRGIWGVCVVYKVVIGKKNFFCSW